jgi:hypothetical protein
MIEETWLPKRLLARPARGNRIGIQLQLACAQPLKRRNGLAYSDLASDVILVCLTNGKQNVYKVNTPPVTKLRFTSKLRDRLRSIAPLQNGRDAALRRPDSAARCPYHGSASVKPSEIEIQWSLPQRQRFLGCRGSRLLSLPVLVAAATVAGETLRSVGCNPR